MSLNPMAEQAIQRDFDAEEQLESRQPEEPEEPEDDSDDSAFAKTPIRGDSDSECDANSSSSSSSDSGPHYNERGDKTYFHVWSDMLTCDEMDQLDSKALTESPNYAADDVEAKLPEGVHKPLSIDTSLPCPLIQFGPVPKRRSSARKPETSAAAASAAAAAAMAMAAAVSAGDDLSGSAAVAAGSGGHNNPVEEAEAPETAGAEGGCGRGHRHCKDERCCDFSLVAEKNNARRKLEEKMRRRERRKLIRY